MRRRPAQPQVLLVALPPQRPRLQLELALLVTELIVNLVTEVFLELNQFEILGLQVANLTLSALHETDPLLLT